MRTFGWNVGKLKELIKDLPDDTPILVPGSDHSYYQPDCSIAPAEYNERGDWFEYYGDKYMSEGGKRVETTLVVGG